LLKLIARSDWNASGRPLGESPSDVDGLLRCGQRLLLPAEIRKAKAQVA
jgi:hypothetical protein